MKTRAPEFRALIIIFGSAGPVISTRRSSRSRGCRRDVPLGRPDLGGGRREVRLDPGVELLLAVLAGLEQPDPLVAEAALEVGDERQRVGRQDLVGAGDVDVLDDDRRIGLGGHALIVGRGSVAVCVVVVFRLVLGDPDLHDPAHEVERDRPAGRESDRSLAGEVRRQLRRQGLDDRVARREQAVVLLEGVVRDEELAVPS